MDREHQLHRWETMYFALVGEGLPYIRSGREKRKSWLEEEARRAGSQGGQPSISSADGYWPYLAFAENRDEEAIELLSKTRSLIDGAAG